MDDDEIILAEGGTPKKRLRVSLQQFEQQPLLNIRYFYEDNQGVMKPTRKGVSITRNRYLDLAEAIEKHHDSIMSYLETGIVKHEFSSWQQLTQQARFQSGAVSEIRFDALPLRGMEVGEVTYEGSKVTVELNTKHPFVKRNVNDDQILAFLARVITAFDLAAKLTSDSESLEVQHAVERLRQELFRQLRNLPVE